MNADDFNSMTGKIIDGVLDRWSQSQEESASNGESVRSLKPTSHRLVAMS